jgi:hypothetical protein
MLVCQINRREFIAAVCEVVASPLATRAQQRAMPAIGLLADISRISQNVRF